MARLERIKGKERVIYLFANHQGTPELGRTGNGTWKYRDHYTPYGEHYHKEHATSRNNPGFTGHVEDYQTGLTYMQARYYDPALGRFLSNDPVGFVDSGFDPAYFNRYAYVRNDPINFTDPNGEQRFGINLSFKIAGGHGFKVGINLNFDTETREIGGSVTGGYRAGAALAAKGEFYVEPSSEQGNQASIRGDVKVEAQAELYAVVGDVEASGELEVVGVEASSETGLDANGPRLEGSAGASAGPASIDVTTGRTTYSIGGGVGVAAGADVTILGNHSLDDEKIE